MLRVLFKVILAVVVIFEFDSKSMCNSILQKKKKISQTIMIINYLKPRGKEGVKFYLKTFRTIIFTTYDGLDIGLVCSGIYTSRS